MSIIVLQLAICTFNIYIAKTENKRNIYIATFAFNTANLILYIITKDTATALSYIIITFRSLVYIEKDKIKYDIIPIAFIVIHAIVGAGSISKWYQILSLLAPCITCYYMWYCKTTQQLRIGNIVVNTIWLIFNLISGLYILCINRVVAIVSNGIEYRRHRYESMGKSKK